MEFQVGGVALSLPKKRSDLVESGKTYRVEYLPVTGYILELRELPPGRETPP